MKRCSLALALLLAASYICVASTYYVDPVNGNDAGSGTQLSPWRTIQKSMNAATPGSTVNIKAGTYHERLALNVSGTAGNYITFQPAGYTGLASDGAACGASISANGYKTCVGARVILDYTYLGTVTKDSTPFLNINNKSYVKIQGVTFQNYTCNGSFKQGVRIDGGSHDIQLLNNRFLHNKNVHGSRDGTSALLHIRVRSSNNVTLRGNELGDIQTCMSEALTLDTPSCTNAIVQSNYVHDTDAIALDINNGANHATIRANLLEYISIRRDGTVWYNNAANAIYVQGGNTSTVERNVVRDSGWAYAVLTEPGYPDTHDITVRDNLAYRNRHGAALMCGNWYSNTDGSNVYNVHFSNNTAYSNLHGIYVRPYTSASVSWKNNILSSNTDNYANGLGWPVGTIKYNLYFGSNVGPDANKVTANPQFTAPGASPPDLSIQATSPAKNAGYPNFVPGAGETDFLGYNRVVGGRVDIGAYEIQ